MIYQPGGIMTKPLYQTIKEHIKNDIYHGKYHAHDQLPSENDIAATFNVSRITSKRVLNDLEQEGLIYRKRGLGSFVSPIEKITASRDLTDILFIMPFPDTYSFGNYTQGILQALQDTPYRLQVQQNSKISAEQLQDIATNYAGIIFYPFNNNDILEYAYPLYLLNVPTVILDKEVSGVPFSSIISNNFQGGYLATQHLIDQELKNIAYISTTRIEDVSSVRERYFGYLKALSDSGLNHNAKPIYCNLTKNADDFKDLIHVLIASGINGIVCENDILAISIMNALTHLNYSIPHDFKIVGFDNTQASQFVNPPLTTLEQNFKQIGMRAMQHLLKIIQDPNTPQERLIIDVSLIKRESTHN